MSLADQSQQWYPTSVQVTVLQARNLRIKGKNGTNDAYAIMQVAKDKFSTSVAEKCVAPVWKEEATFDLPLFHHGNAERCTLYIIVMHRAPVGLDKHLGQAVINLLELHDSKSTKKTDWYKLVDKAGKADKERGEVLLDLQFMRNNMTASMFDLSAHDKPRSRIAKLKDKVRGRKKDVGFSDSASAVVPSSSQVLTDSEGEGEGGRPESPAAKKKSKLKSLFAPKTNLQRNVSQSMSTLGSLPERNGSLGGSRASGLNVESPDVKKKFKFLGHKRTSSNDSKVSQGPFSLLGRSKQKDPEANLCINGSHVYAEEQEPKAPSGSTLSLSSSGQGSAEDVQRSHERTASDTSADSLRGLSVPSYRPEPRDRGLHAQQGLREEEEEEEEEKRQAEMLDRQEGQERRRREETRRKLQEEEEQEMRRQEEARLAAEGEQRRRREEEARRAEEQKHHAEATVTDKLSSLFGIGRKKEEKKEEQQQESPRHSSRELEAPHAPSNPFEEIPLSSDPLHPSSEENPADANRGARTPHTPTSVFPSRTAKVSAVKPRLAVSPKSETDKSNPAYPTANSDTLSEVSPSSLSSESSLSSVPSESLDMFSNLHSSLAPPRARRSSSESPRGSMENLSAVGSYVTSEKKRKAPLPPQYLGKPKNENQQPAHGVQPDPGMPKVAPRSVSGKTAASSGYLLPIKETEGGGGDERAGSQQGQKPPLPLPDYETLFPKRRHGVMSHTRWDHIIAEVNQRRMDNPPELRGEEMSVDGPFEPSPNAKPAVLKERPTASLNQSHRPYVEAPSNEWRRMESRNKQALVPPKSNAAAPPRQVVEVNAKQGYATVQSNPTSGKPTHFDDKLMGTSPVPMVQNIDRAAAMPREFVESERRVLNTTVSQPVLPKEKPTPSARTVWDAKSTEDAIVETSPKEIPSVKPRQRVPHKETVRQAQPEQTSAPTVTSSESAPEEHNSRGSRASVLVEEAAVEAKSNPVSAKEAEVVIISDMQPSSISQVKYDNISKAQLVEHVSEALPTKEVVVESDPFPNDGLLTEDPWALPQQSTGGEDLFTGGPQRHEKIVEQGLTSDDLDDIFAPRGAADPFASFAQHDSAKSTKSPVQDKPGSSEPGSSLQRGPSPRRKQAPQPPTSLVNTEVGKSSQDKQDPLPEQDKEDTKVTLSGTGGLKTEFDAWTPDGLNSGEKNVTQASEEPWVADPFTTSSPIPTTLATPEALKTADPLPGGSSGVKTPLRAWVSPSEVQPITVQSGSGGGPASTPRRPHPVKPMSSTESQPTSSVLVGKDLKSISIHEVPEKTKVVENGPYTQLTQEELITLVVKQQTALSKKDSKILELEEYIDNLLVRVIEEKPSILLTLNATKAAH